MIKSISVALVSLALLAGCALFGSDDNTEPPAKLKSFDKRVEFRRVWSHSTGSGTDEQLLRLAPVVDGQQVYAADRNGAVWAYELDSGKTLWRRKTGIALSAGPGAGDGLVLAASSEGQLIALSADSGEPLWQTEVPSEVMSVPQVYEGVVIVQTVDGAISALDADSGERLWVYDRSVPVLSLRGTSTPFVDEGVVLAGFANGKMVALEVENGREIWDAAVAVPHGRTELQRMVDLDANPVVDGNVLYASSYQGRIVAVSLEDGRMLWNRDMSAYAGIAVDNRQIFVSDADSEVWSMDRRNGGALWKQPDLRHRSLTGPAVIDEYVVVGDFEGYVHLLSREDGSMAGRTRVDSDGVQATPVSLSGDRLLVLGAGGKLVLYKLEAR